jgi:hypothetical protein
MATSWFKFATPGVAPNPNTNPLSYVQFLGVPTPNPVGGTRMDYIFATTQIINSTVRPVITGVLATEINTAVSHSTSSTNAYVKP